MHAPFSNKLKGIKMRKNFVLPAKATTMNSVENISTVDNIAEYFTNEFNVLEGILASFEHLTHASDIISEYGVSTPIMKLIDHNNELISNEFLNIDYNDITENDVDVALEGISSAINHLIAKVKDVFKRIGDKIKRMIADDAATTQDLRGWILSATDTFKGIHDLDVEKFENTSYVLFAKRDTDKMVNTIKYTFKQLTTMVDKSTADLVKDAFDNKKFDKDSAIRLKNSINNSIKAVFTVNFKNMAGATIRTDNEGDIVFSADVAKFVNWKNQKIKEAGWKYDDVKSYIDSLKNMAELYDITVRHTGDKLLKLGSIIEQKVQNDRQFSDGDTDQRYAIQYVLKQIYRIYYITLHVINKIRALIRRLAVQLRNLAKAVKNADKP